MLNTLRRITYSKRGATGLGCSIMLIRTCLLPNKINPTKINPTKINLNEMSR